MNTKFKQMSNKDKQTAYVFGGSGYIGYELCRVLSKQFDIVTNLDIESRKFEQDNIKFQRFDILDASDPSDVIGEYANVYYLAGLSDLNEGVRSPVKTASMNILALVKILESLSALKHINFFYFSSVYAEGQIGSFYGVSKQAAENYLKEFGSQYPHFKFDIFRLGSVYGGAVDKRNGLYKIAAAALKGEDKWYNGSPITARDYVHVSDVCHKIAQISKEGAKNKTYLITGNEKIKVADVCSLIEESLGLEHANRISDERYLGHYVQTPYRVPEPPIRLTLEQSTDFSWAINDFLNRVKNEEP